MRLFRPLRGFFYWRSDPRLTPWAVFLCRFAAFDCKLTKVRRYALLGPMSTTSFPRLWHARPEPPCLGSSRISLIRPSTAPRILPCAYRLPFQPCQRVATSQTPTLPVPLLAPFVLAGTPVR